MLSKWYLEDIQIQTKGWKPLAKTHERDLSPTQNYTKPYTKVSTLLKRIKEHPQNWGLIFE